MRIENFFVALLLPFIASLVTVTSKTGPIHDKLVVCYISTWAVYRPDRGSYSLDHFDANLCTHAIYAFSGLDIEKDAIKSLDPWQDLKDNYGKGGYEHLTNLRKTYPHLKVTLAIGGWNEGSANYSMMAADPVRRKRFVQNASEFVRKYNFDGLDLDWEYPSVRGGQPHDKVNFAALVKELKENFKKYNLLLTSAIGASKNTIDLAYDVKVLSEYLDYMHIMCYDYGGSWDGRVSANAPLTSQDTLNVQYTIKYLIELGANPAKIVMGIPFYGRTFVTHLEGNYGDASNAVGFQGPYTREDGFLGFNEMCNLLTDEPDHWSESYDVDTAQAIARSHDKETDETKVVVFDNTRSIANKVRFVVRQKLAGAMVWSADTDDFHGECKLNDDTYADFQTIAGVKLSIPKRINTNYPLLRTINEAVLVAEDEWRQEGEINDGENEIPHGDDDDDNGSSANFNVCFNLLAISLVFNCVFVKMFVNL